MADEEQRRHSTDDATGARPRHAPYDNTRSAQDEEESVVGDNDLAMRGVGAAGENAGTGVPGLGGAPGGTPNSGGVGLPGGNRKLGTSHAPPSDASATDTGDRLGTGGNAHSGHGQTSSTDVLPGGATRPAASTSNSAPSSPTAEERADRSALRTDAAMSTASGGAAGSDISRDRDEAATRARGDAGGQSMPLPPGPDAPVPDAPQYDVNSPIWNAAAPSTPEHPVPEEPLPGVIERPGPEAET